MHRTFRFALELVSTKLDSNLVIISLILPFHTNRIDYVFWQ